MRTHPWLVVGALALASCAVTTGEYAGVASEQVVDTRNVYGPFAGPNWPLAQSPYGDWFATGPQPFQDRPYYHWYPNLDYYANYRPIYP